MTGLCTILVLLLLVSIATTAEIDLYSKLLDIERIVSAQGKRISELEGTVAYQRKEIIKLNNIIKVLQLSDKDVGTIPEKTYGNNSKDVDEKRSHLKPDASEKDHYQRKRDPNKNRVSRLLTPNIPVQPSTVAFYAYMNVAETNIGSHHPLVFDVLVTNYGNGYNKHTGIFTAQQNGVYAFSFTVFPNYGSYVAVNIYRNSEVVGQVYSHNNHPNFSGTSMVAVVSLSIGDVTFIRTSSTTASSGSIFSNKDVKSSFAGWKIADLI